MSAIAVDLTKLAGFELWNGRLGLISLYHLPCSRDLVSFGTRIQFFNYLDEAVEAAMRHLEGCEAVGSLD